VFGGLDYSVTSALTLQGSVRYTHSKRVFDGCAQDAGDGQLATAFGFLSNLLHGISSVPGPGDPNYIAPGACVTFDNETDAQAGSVHEEANENNTSWRGGASYRVSDDVMFYGNVR
jgi:iron complex outermembrane receptor protein